MTPVDVKSARQTLGLTQAQLAVMLDTDATVIRRMEMAPDKNSYRPPAPRMLRLIAAYLAGYRPADWPAKHWPDLWADEGNASSPARHY